MRLAGGGGISSPRLRPSGLAAPVWANNSNSTGTNPDRTHKGFDVYTCQFVY